MENYKPTIQDQNHNVSSTSPWKVVGKYALFLAVVTVFFYLLSLIFVIFISHEREADIFKGFHIADLGEKNEEQTEYVSDLLEKLKPHVSEVKHITIEVVCNDEFNALTLPGQKIVIFSGLIEEMQSENELYYVIAHEVSHAKNQDVLRKMVRVLPLTFIDAVILGNSSNNSGLSSIVNISFGKSWENRADEEALSWTYLTYGHLGGVEQFFLTMQKQEFFAFLTAFSDHPLTVSRSNMVSEYIKTNKISIGKTKPLPEFDYSFCY